MSKKNTIAFLRDEIKSPVAKEKKLEYPKSSELRNGKNNEHLF